MNYQHVLAQEDTVTQEIHSTARGQPQLSKVTHGSFRTHHVLHREFCYTNHKASRYEFLGQNPERNDNCVYERLDYLSSIDLEGT